MHRFFRNIHFQCSYFLDEEGKEYWLMLPRSDEEECDWEEESEVNEKMYLFNLQYILNYICARFHDMVITYFFKIQGRYR